VSARTGAETPSERSMRARRAAHLLHSQVDGRAHTAAARAASPAHLAYHERQVDPTGELPVAERLRRAEHARKAYFVGIALRSAQARRARAKGGDANAPRPA
jgi:hypothetical protein